MCLLFVWLGFALVPVATRALHALTNRQLQLGRHWFGVPPTAPAGSGAALPALRSTSGSAPPLVRRALSVLRAPATLGLWAGPYVLRAQSRVSQAVLGSSDAREWPGPGRADGLAEPLKPGRRSDALREAEGRTYSPASDR